MADALRTGLPKLNDDDNAFTAALEAVPVEDWCRTWAAGRTIMLRRTSKRVKGVVDKMRLPVLVRLRRSFWDDARNGTAAEKLQVMMRQLALATARCRISTLELPLCAMKGQDAESLAEALGQCRELVHLNLSGNKIGAGGAERLAGVLAQCPVLAHLNLVWNFIKDEGADWLAGVLAQCAALAHLDLHHNNFGAAGAEIEFSQRCD
jgi:Ran GTPase-activating protein (RanGAP) involved in mRNA processing and transport